MRRNKLHSAIHIFGLAIAFSICILLFLTAYFHLSFDSFHRDKPQLFRTSRLINSAQGTEMSSQMPLPAAAALRTDIPEVEAAIVVNMGMPENFSYEEKNIERVIVRTDPNFFDMFNFPVLIGNGSTALSGFQDIALSETTAKAIFGESDPIGKELKIGRGEDVEYYTVTAVVKDCPNNSSIRFDAVARIQSLPNYAQLQNNWGSNGSSVFVKISKNSDLQKVAMKLEPFVEKYYPDQLAQLRSGRSDVKKSSELLSINLTNINDIHFSGERSSSKLLVYALMSLGAFILLIACFNFVNLNMANSFKRSRELGVRQTLGAYKGQLFMQLWGEALLLYFIGFMLGLGLASQLIPVFNAQFGGGIEISALFQPAFLAIMIGVFLLVTLIAGGYPALKMANFSLVGVLKGKISTKRPGALRNSLLVSQFAISSLLICISWIAGQQLDFLREVPIGFEKEQVISIPVGFQQDGRKILARMRNELQNDPNIVSITGTGGNLGRGLDKVTVRSVVGFEYKQNQVSADWLLADYDFLKTLQIPIIKGRDFDPAFATDTINAFVVTESFVKAMGEPDPIGKYFGGEEAGLGNRIIGVIPDFNAYSPSDKSYPIAIHLSATERINYIFLKVQSDNPQLVMEHIALVWEKLTDNALFNASFLDENLQAWYEGEIVMTTVFSTASAIAIFLSCLGLFAISLMVIELRTKEIGIRKVVGASVKSIVGIISIHFVKLVLLSLLIAVPLAWYIMQMWIENYEYRISIDPLIFLGVGAMVIAVALFTVSFHTIKAAIVNPVKSLRTE
ncbi:FtsX-like permease family protein [Arenibacter palladensis]|uniref:ABC transporter permease n=1 Tax=Arenibacter palladensis TaxID=237373 RepID=UPI002FD4D23C